MAEKKRRGGGGKLARTETVQVRLDPKLRFAAELAAAKERRTLSSFIEWAVERAVKDVSVILDKEGRPLSADQVTERVWDVDESDRFVNMAWRHPGLLTHSEQRKWKFIFETAEFWQVVPVYVEANDGDLGEGAIRLSARGDGAVDVARYELNRPLLRAAWELVEKHISGGEIFDADVFHVLIQQFPPEGMPVTFGDHEPTIYLLRDKLKQEQGSASEAQALIKDSGGEHGA